MGLGRTLSIKCSHCNSVDILTPKVSRIETFCRFLLFILTFPGNLLITYNIPPKFTNNSFYSNYRNHDVFPLLKYNRFLLCTIPPIQHSLLVIPSELNVNFLTLDMGTSPNSTFLPIMLLFYSFLCPKT